MLKTFDEIRFDNSLYYLALPGFVLIAGGLYMGLNFVRTCYSGGSFNPGSTLLMILLTLVGTLMVFTGVLLHLTAGLIKYTINRPHFKQ